MGTAGYFFSRAAPSAKIHLRSDGACFPSLVARGHHRYTSLAASPTPPLYGSVLPSAIAAVQPLGRARLRPSGQKFPICPPQTVLELLRLPGADRRRDARNRLLGDTRALGVIDMTRHPRLRRGAQLVARHATRVRRVGDNAKLAAATCGRWRASTSERRPCVRQREGDRTLDTARIRDQLKAIFRKSRVAVA